MLSKSTRRQLLPALLSLTAMLTSSCGISGGSATSQAICDELRVDLPSYSSRDTDQSKAEGLRFLRTFDAVCA